MIILSELSYCGPIKRQIACNATVIISTISIVIIWFVNDLIMIIIFVAAAGNIFQNGSLNGNIID
jgi:hypothetical protein